MQCFPSMHACTTSIKLPRGFGYFVTASIELLLRPYEDCPAFWPQASSSLRKFWTCSMFLHVLCVHGDHITSLSVSTAFPRRCASPYCVLSLFCGRGGNVAWCDGGITILATILDWNSGSTKIIDKCLLTVCTAGPTSIKHCITA